MTRTMEMHAVFGTQAEACDENMQALLEGTAMNVRTYPITRRGTLPPTPPNGFA